MNDHDYNALFTSLDDAIDILERNRRADPAYIAAFDTLKQSRARLVKALDSAPVSLIELEVAAA